MISIDIVIPCAGRADDVLRLLGSLYDQGGESLRRHCASITLSDDRWTAELGQRVRSSFPAVTYVPGPARGPAANRNNGARNGQADWLLFLDDDCFADVDVVGAYARRVELHRQTEVFEGAIRPVGPRPNGNHHAPLNLEGGKLWSCNFLVRRDVFRAADGFDEAFPYACLEDCDLRDRLQAQQRRFTFVPEAAVLHPWRSISEREVSRQIVSHAIYAERHPSFVEGWTLPHLLRAVRGRYRQYVGRHFWSIPLNKYRTVGFDLIAPVVVFWVVRLGPLRRAVSRRYINRT